MQFHLEKNEDLTAVLKIGMATDDYAEKVERQIQEVRKTIQMPGFRKGNVPAGLIRKQYGQGILIEEVNKLLQEGINGYIKEQQLTLLGQPMPREKSDIDWSSDLQEFEFDLGLAPVKLNISEKRTSCPTGKWTSRMLWWTMRSILFVVDTARWSRWKRSALRISYADRAGGWPHAFGGFPTR